MKEEFCNHILLHCDLTRLVRDLLFSLFGVFWVLSSSDKEVLLSWQGSFVGKKRLKVWRTAPLCFWTIWPDRNRREFEDKELFVHRIKSNFLCSLWAWSFVHMSQGPSTVVDFVDWVD